MHCHLVGVEPQHGNISWCLPLPGFGPLANGYGGNPSFASRSALWVNGLALVLDRSAGLKKLWQRPSPQVLGTSEWANCQTTEGEAPGRQNELKHPKEQDAHRLISQDQQGTRDLYHINAGGM